LVRRPDVAAAAASPGVEDGVREPRIRELETSG
jgi:hypothetical protein